MPDAEKSPRAAAPRLRRLAVLALVLLGIEGAATVADRYWSFRDRLLRAFETATRINESDAEERWDDPTRPFASGDDSSAPLRFRTAGSWSPAGEEIDPATLPPGKRVIVLGESAAFGVGCRAEETFAARLAESLQDQGVQVLNAGQVGADAWEVLVAGAQLLDRYAPSVLVIFTGNNLWIDWTPPQQPRWNPWAVKLLSALATSRTIAAVEFLSIRTALLHTSRQWRVEELGTLDGLLRAPDGEGGDGPSADGPFRDHFELRGSRYALAHPLEDSAEFGAADWAAVQQRHLQRFETSLETLAPQARARGVRVVLVTMPFNYRLSPAWKHPQFESVDPAHRDEVRALLRSGARSAQAGDCRAALEAVDRALGLDPAPPLLHYLRAQCLEQLGRIDEARAAYAQSREQMIGNLGSRLSINEVIRRVAVRNDLELVDAAAIFEAHGQATSDPFNEQLILDDCHPSPAAHRLIAEALVPLLSPGASGRAPVPLAARTGPEHR